MTKSAEKNPNIIQEMTRVARMHHILVDTRMNSLNIHQTQHKMLMELYMAEKVNPDAAVTQRDLSERFALTPAAVAMNMKKLTAAGYVTRKVSERDNRFNFVYLTDAGRELVEKTITMFDEIDDVLLANTTPEQVAAFSEVLGIMRKNMEMLPEFRQYMRDKAEKEENEE